MSLGMKKAQKSVLSGRLGGCGSHEKCQLDWPRANVCTVSMVLARMTSFRANRFGKFD